MPRFLNDERFVWIAFGAFSIFAVITAHSQLCAFKKRCEVRTEQRRDNINQETEDALKLETLAVLARSVNFDLRNAALKIIGERATTGDKYDYLLYQLYSPDPEVRLKALKVMIYLASGAPIEPINRLCTPQTFKALVHALMASLDEPPEICTERELFRILGRLMQFNHELAIQAGVIKWFERRPEVVAAYFEPNKFEQLDVNLIIIIALLLHFTKDGKSSLEKLLPETAVRENYQSRAWQQHHAILAMHEISRGVNRVFPSALNVFL
ncbi:hypothetical protein BDZ91DRAFT_720585 [Kalaharituber pfeilii]|nr:hypothetical protein BDZ91DRAFT_720585 [Kalaharituber pfeilii]